MFAAVPDVDILVNNLGIFGRNPAFEITDDDWHRFFEVNVMSGVRLTRHYAPGMAGEAGAASSSSPANRPQHPQGDDPLRHEQDRPARHLARLCQELAGTGVTVNALLPGPTHTENTDRLRAERAKTAGITVAEIEATFFRDSDRPR